MIPQTDALQTDLLVDDARKLARCRLLNLNRPLANHLTFGKLGTKLLDQCIQSIAIKVPLVLIRFKLDRNPDFNDRRLAELHYGRLSSWHTAS